MKNKNNHKRRNPAKHKLTTLHQLSKLIPAHLVAQAAKESGLDKKNLKFCPWSHVLSLMFAQLSRTASLWDLCANLRFHAAKFRCIRGAYVPARNTLSHANRTRSPVMAETLYWMLADYCNINYPGYSKVRRYAAIPPKFKRAIHAMDSSTIPLVFNCIDWAKHRRQKAAAKLHLRLDLKSFLPAMVIISEAKGHDSTKAAQLCADLKAGAILIADRAYLHFKRLFELHERGVFWVLRNKTNINLIVCKKCMKKPDGNLLRDDLVKVKDPKKRKDYPEVFRRITARVMVKNKLVEMEFITNNLAWSAQTIVDLYQARWAIEVFFKEIKQTLNLKSFLGYNENAVRWQIWTALLLRLLLRLLKFISGWRKGFMKLFQLVSGVLWDRFDLQNICDFYGTASGESSEESTFEQLELIEIYPPFSMGMQWDSKRRKWRFQNA